MGISDETNRYIIPIGSWPPTCPRLNTHANRYRRDGRKIIHILKIKLLASIKKGTYQTRKSGEHFT